MKQAVKSLRVGFLGTGYIADWHAKALGTIPGASLVAVCDKDLPRARTFGERYGAARVTNRWNRCSGTGSPSSTSSTCSSLRTCMLEPHRP